MLSSHITFVLSMDYCFLWLFLDIYWIFHSIFHVSLKLSHILFLFFYFFPSSSFQSIIFSLAMSYMLFHSSTELNLSNYVFISRISIFFCSGIFLIIFIVSFFYIVIFSFIFLILLNIHILLILLVNLSSWVPIFLILYLHSSWWFVLYVVCNFSLSAYFQWGLLILWELNAILLEGMLLNCGSTSACARYLGGFPIT